MVFKPWNERKRGSLDILPEMTAKMNTVAGLKSLSSFLQPCRAVAPVRRFSLWWSHRCPEQVARVADELVQRAIKSKLFYFADSDLKFDQPQVDIQIDRNRRRTSA